MNEGLWRALMGELLRDHAVASSDYSLYLPQHQVTLDVASASWGRKLQSIIAAALYDPPWVRELAARVQSPEEEIRRPLGKCAVQRQVYQIVKDLFYHSDTVRQLRSELQTLYMRHNVILAAEFRDASALGANAPSSSWSSSTALAILDAFLGAGSCATTAAGTIPLRCCPRSEGMRIRWCGRASNPVGGAKRFSVGSTPATFRHPVD